MVDSLHPQADGRILIATPRGTVPPDGASSALLWHCLDPDSSVVSPVHPEGAPIRLPDGAPFRWRPDPEGRVLRLPPAGA